MYCNLTGQIQTGLDRMWEQAALCGRLEQAVSAEEYLAVLQDAGRWSSLSFCLRRYIYLRFTGRAPEEEPIPYTVVFEGKTYVFTPVFPEAEIDADEVDNYAELMYRMTLSNGWFHRDKHGNVDPKQGAIPKKQYINYLNGQRISREKLFLMALSLGFDHEDMARFMNALGESPVYNFRSAEECIYFFCQHVPGMNDRYTQAELTARYGQIRRGALPAAPEGAGTTDRLSCELGDIVDDEELSADEKKEAFVAFLEENAAQFVQFGKSARELLIRELNSEQLLDTRRSKPGSKSNKVDDAFIHPDMVEEKLLEEPGIRGSGVFDDLFAALYRRMHKENLRVRRLDLDSRMTTNLTDGAHLRGVFGGALSEDGEENDARERVTKQDFLLVRLQKFDELVARGGYTAEERMRLMKRFRSSTDHILYRAGLPPIYVANPLDHTVLTALCMKQPARFTRELYFRAVKEDGE